MASRRIFLVAGERSGDMHGGHLVAALREKAQSPLTLAAWGGDHMAQAGADLQRHYRDYSTHGIFEVIAKYPRLRRMMKQCQQDIARFQPDLLVLIDFGGWNLRLAGWAHRRGIRVHYFIPPKVWAWNEGRVKKLNAYVDQAYCILPFEEEYYRQHGLTAHYVGNALVQDIRQFMAQPRLPQGLPTEKPLVALLPGSRPGELKYILPAMVQLPALLPQYQFAVSGVDTVDAELYAPAKEAGIPIVWENSYGLLHQAEAAVVASGTATLETALIGTPQTVVYRTAAATFALGRRLVKVPWMGLVNLVPNRLVARELLQRQCEPKTIAAEVESLFDPDRREKMVADYDQIRQLMGNAVPGLNAAEKMLLALGE